MSSFLQPLLLHGATGYQITNARSGRVVARELLTAFDSQSRRRGLLHQSSLGENTAMIIAPSNAIHTFFMKFPIDVAFVSKSGRVLKVRAAVPAWRIAASLRAFAVLEIAAGALERSDTKAGDQLLVSAFP